MGFLTKMLDERNRCKSENPKKISNQFPGHADCCSNISCIILYILSISKSVAPYNMSDILSFKISFVKTSFFSSISSFPYKR